jgi:hypothetical protein
MHCLALLVFSHICVVTQQDPHMSDSYWCLCDLLPRFLLYSPHTQTSQYPPLTSLSASHQSDVVNDARLGKPFSSMSTVPLTASGSRSDSYALLESLFKFAGSVHAYFTYHSGVFFTSFCDYFQSSVHGSWILLSSANSPQVFAHNWGVLETSENEQCIIFLLKNETGLY